MDTCCCSLPACCTVEGAEEAPEADPLVLRVHRVAAPLRAGRRALRLRAAERRPGPGAGAWWTSCCASHTSSKLGTLLSRGLLVGRRRRGRRWSAQALLAPCRLSSWRRWAIAVRRACGNAAHLSVTERMARALRRTWRACAGAIARSRARARGRRRRRRRAEAIVALQLEDRSLRAVCVRRTGRGAYVLVVRSGNAGASLGAGRASVSAVLLRRAKCGARRRRRLAVVGRFVCERLLSGRDGRRAGIGARGQSERQGGEQSEVLQRGDPGIAHGRAPSR